MNDGKRQRLQRTFSRVEDPGPHTKESQWDVPSRIN